MAYEKFPSHHPLAFVVQARLAASTCSEEMWGRTYICFPGFTLAFFSLSPLKAAQFRSAAPCPFAFVSVQLAQEKKVGSVMMHCVVRWWLPHRAHVSVSALQLFV